MNFNVYTQNTIHCSFQLLAPTTSESTCQGTQTRRPTYRQDAHTCQGRKCGCDSNYVLRFYISFGNRVARETHSNHETNLFRIHSSHRLGTAGCLASAKISKRMIPSTGSAAMMSSCISSQFSRVILNGLPRNKATTSTGFCPCPAYARD